MDMLIFQSKSHPESLFQTALLLLNTVPIQSFTAYTQNPTSGGWIYGAIIPMQHIKPSYNRMVSGFTSNCLFRYICSSVTNNGSTKTTFSASFQRTGLTLASSTSHSRRGTFSSQLDACARLQSNLSSSSLHRQQLTLRTNKQKINLPPKNPSLVPTYAPSQEAQHRFRVFYNLPLLCWTTRKVTADFILS